MLTEHTKSFTNELNNEISISCKILDVGISEEASGGSVFLKMVGPKSESEWQITRMEAEVLSKVLKHMLKTH